MPALHDHGPTVATSSGVTGWTLPTVGDVCYRVLERFIFPDVTTPPVTGIRRAVRADQRNVVAITEESRYQLFQRAGQVLGEDEAATLMELLPTVGWADVATKRDLDHQRVALSADIDAMGAALRSELHDQDVALRSEIHALGTGLRTEMGELRDEMRSEMGELRSEMRSDMSELRSEMRAMSGDLRAEMYREQRNHTLAMIGANTAIAALVVAALQIL